LTKNRADPRTMLTQEACPWQCLDCHADLPYKESHG
jgi:hypothetical protein